MTLGSQAAISPARARDIAGDLHAQVRLGRDPSTEKAERRARAAETMGAVLQNFLAFKRGHLKPRSMVEIERHLMQSCKSLHGLQLAKIDRRAVAAKISTVANEKDHAPVRRYDCDVVAIKVEDVAPNGYAVDRATVRQRKTGRPVRFELTEHTRQAIDAYLKSSRKKPGESLFTGPRSGRSMTPRQYGRLVSNWLIGIGLDAHLYGTHSLRRTKATLIYRRTGNLRAVQLLLGHTKIESTVRYLGIDVDDALTIAEQVDV
jgi:hypothetical protein